MTYEELMEKAIEVSKNAYVPFSKFPVGACVLTENGKTFCGCNFDEMKPYTIKELLPEAFLL